MFNKITNFSNPVMMALIGSIKYKKFFLPYSRSSFLTDRGFVLQFMTKLRISFVLAFLKAIYHIVLLAIDFLFFTFSKLGIYLSKSF